MAERASPRVLAAMAFLLAAGACAQSKDYLVWYKEGASDADLQQAQYECERDTRMSAASFGPGPLGTANAQAFAQRCMNSKGFTLRSATQLYAVPARPPEPDPPMRDAQGRDYQANDKVRCSFSNGETIVTFPAQTCVRGRGTILGPPPA